jgi:hypothetical protein
VKKTIACHCQQIDCCTEKSWLEHKRLKLTTIQQTVQTSAVHQELASAVCKSGVLKDNDCLTGG